MTILRKTSAILIAGAILVFLFMKASDAAEWSISPSFSMQGDYDSNILLTTQSHDSVTSTTVSPRLDLGVASSNWQLTGGAELTRRRFPGRNDLNSDAQNLNLGSFYRTERSVWQLNAESASTFYLVDRAINSDIGLFSVNTGFDRKSITPSWTWSATELTQLQLMYSQNDISYVNGQANGLYDYRSSTLSLKLSTQWDMYTQVYVSPAYSYFRVPATTFESKTTSGEVGVTHTFSQTTSGALSVGGRNTSSERVIRPCALFIGPDCFLFVDQRIYSRDASSIYSASFDKQFEVVHLSASIKRSFDPSALGQQVRTDLATISIGRPLTPTLDGTLTMVGQKINSETGDTSGVDDRRFYQIEPSLRWRWSPEWNIAAAYRYTHLRRVSETKAATSNSAYLTVRYQWPKISISR